MERRCSVDGSTIEYFFNGASAESFTDTSITGNLLTGMVANSGTAKTTLDIFSAADLAAAADDTVLQIITIQ